MARHGDKEVHLDFATRIVTLLASALLQSSDGAAEGIYEQ